MAPLYAILEAMKAPLRFLSFAVFACAATPLVACGSDGTSDDSSEQREQQDEIRESMKTTWLGAWEGELIGASGASPSFSLTLDYRAPGSTPQCGTVELDDGVSLRCVTNYQLGVTGTLTTNDGRFQNTAVTGLVEYGGLRLELPEAGFLHIDEGGSSGSFSYGEGQRSGTINAHKK